MRRFFIKNILFVIAANVIVKPIWVFLIDRNVQNTVAAGDYGTYQALMSLSIIFQTVLDFGITNYNSRTISMNPERLPTLFPAMLSARLVLMMVYMVLALAGGWLWGYRGWELSLLVGVLLVQSLNALVAFIRSNVSALHRFKTDGVLSIVDRLLMIVICGVLLGNRGYFGTFKIEWFVVAQIFCYLTAAVAGYIILRRIGKVKLSFSFSVPEILGVMRKSLPYALLIFQMSIYNRADAVMIERLRVDGKVQADMWAAAFRLLEVSNMFGLMFATMLLPLFGRMLAQGEDVGSIVRLCVNIMLPMSVVVGVGCFFSRNEVMHMLYKACTADEALGLQYGYVFAILMASFPAWCMMYVYSTLLTANGSLKRLNVIAFLGVVVNLSLNAWLIPRYGAVGGAITSCFTQSLLALLYILVAWRTANLATVWGRVAAHIVFAALCVVAGFVISHVVPGGWPLRFGALFAVGVLLMFLFRFVSVGEFGRLMKLKSAKA
jgi:O-antigen/teichoic acid export membrane protein